MEKFGIGKSLRKNMDLTDRRRQDQQFEDKSKVQNNFHFQGPEVRVSVFKPSRLHPEFLHVKIIRGVSLKLRPPKCCRETLYVEILILPNPTDYGKS